MDQFSIGWLAGIIDGEGTVTIDKESNRYRRPVISVSSTDIEILNRIQGMIGGSITVKNRERAPHHKLAYMWKMHGSQKVIEVLKIIAPHMSCPKKKNRANFILENYRTLTPRNGKYTEQMRIDRLQFEEQFFHV